MPTIEPDIFSRLSTYTPLTATGCTVTPVNLRVNEPALPWLSYAITHAEPVDPELDGAGQLTRYEVGIGLAATDYDELRSVADAVKAALDQFSGGQIAMSVWQSSDLGIDSDTGQFAGSMVFEVVGREAAILPIESGLPVVEVHEDGLYFGGEKIGTAADVDLSDYARLSIDNTFAGSQTITAPAAGVRSLTVKGAASQTASALEVQTSTGTAYVTVGGKRVLTTNGDTGLYVSVQSQIGSSAQTYGCQITNAAVSGSASGTIAGLTCNANSSATSKPPTLLVSNQAACTVTAGSTTQAQAFRGGLAVIGSGASIGTGFGLSIQDGFTASGGSISTLYGVKVEDQTAGSTANYALYTGRGQVVHGDATTITAPTASTLPLKVKGAASQTANLAECQDSSSSVQFAIGPNGQVKTNQTQIVGDFDTLSGLGRVLKVYDTAGTLLGYIPIYTTIVSP